jgi:2,3-bisphosphoglycerate-independent phosphoglycerate mutase
MKRPVVLTILDGYGECKNADGNAIINAKTPNIDAMREKYPNILIHADGEAVGLPDGQMGNSEVGHMNLGAGRIVYQSLVKINKAVSDGSILKNKSILEAMENGKKNALHIIGLLSDGGVHSMDEHIYEVIRMAKVVGVEKIFIHPILDGRDVDPKCALTYLDKLNNVCETNGAQIATITGRYYAMDRDNR